MKALIIIVLALALVTAGATPAHAVSGILKGDIIIALIPIIPIVFLLAIYPFIEAYNAVKGKEGPEKEGQDKQKEDLGGAANAPQQQKQIEPSGTQPN